MWRRVVGGALFCVVAASVAAQAPSADGAAGAWSWCDLQAVSAALGYDDPRFHAVRAGRGFEVDNASHALAATFDGAGVEVEREGHRWSLAFEGLGRAAAVHPAEAVVLRARRNRIELHRGSVTEWWVNGPRGLQQGFTVTRPPAPGASGPLIVSQVLRGDLRPRLHGDGRGLTLERPDGEAVMRYAGLVAFDATGRRLPARLALEGTRLRTYVDDRGARYPVVVDPFVEAAILTASDGSSSVRFGESLAVSGDTVAVGADKAGGGRGAVYVFERPASGWSSTTEVAKLTHTGAQRGDELGSYVAIDGDTVVAGARGADVGGNLGQGAAYVFVKPASGWADANETARLTASDGAPFDNLAFVAVSGDTVVAGTSLAAVGGNVQQGAAYVFEKPASGWSSTTETAKLTASEGAAREFFGPCAIDGDVIVVGATAATVAGQQRQGAGYVFVRPATGWATGSETAKLTASDGSAGSGLGHPVAIDGDSVLIGEANAAYVFEKPASGWVDTTETAKLTASNPMAHQFASSLDLDGDLAVVGALGQLRWGFAYVFRRPSSGWVTATETQEIRASNRAFGDHFGAAAGVSGGVVVVGATFADGPARDSGAVYVFDEPPVAPGSGCGLAAVATQRTRRIGNELLLLMPPCGSGPHALVLGTPAAVAIQLPPSVACGGVSPCLLSCKPLVTVAGTELLLRIPALESLVGSAFCVQGGCIDAGPCVAITDMITVTLSL